jgi:hypothetical protein
VPRQLLWTLVMSELERVKGIEPSS